jgi:hypothetical protein
LSFRDVQELMLERARRHLLSAADYRQVMADRFAVWNEITGATTTAAA